MLSCSKQGGGEEALHYTQQPKQKPALTLTLKEYSIQLEEYKRDKVLTETQVAP